ncbi:dsDNA nuclease domain-containing protein [Lactobacillus sp. PV034]|uniref:dsDNA nuclease domain-containing protein n=1 Tax=Lactobacillus sp. PV034 TaxID=2594495 RepID=UPI00224019D1|nr:dsDNA nuclease domain-containing protein [Lactobacillus sp. PV034]QNQ80520.1 hypothetical protein FP432_02615 [Lactobacillus sp. PV034]
MNGFPTNASYVRKGFNYQDMAALYYFLMHISEIAELNNEGNEDIDVKLKDGTIRYFQAKETKNIDNALKKTELRDALHTLSNNIIRQNYNHLDEVGIITNCNYPFTQKDYNFKVPYKKIDYSGLSSIATKRINDILQEFPKEIDIDFLLSKLSVTKLAYQGSDDASLLERLEIPIYSFMTMARIERSRYRQLLMDWSFLFNRSSENIKYKITPQKFIERTAVTIMDEPNLDKFFSIFQIRTGNKTYISNNYSEQLEKFLNNFKYMSVIQQDFDKYTNKNQNMLQNDLEIEFVNYEYEKISKLMGLNEEEADQDIVKLIIWLRIIHDTYFRNLESIISDED